MSKCVCLCFATCTAGSRSWSTRWQQPLSPHEQLTPCLPFLLKMSFRFTFTFTFSFCGGGALSQQNLQTNVKFDESLFSPTGQDCPINPSISPTRKSAGGALVILSQFSHRTWETLPHSTKTTPNARWLFGVFSSQNTFFQSNTHRLNSSSSRSKSSISPVSESTSSFGLKISSANDSRRKCALLLAHRNKKATPQKSARFRDVGVSPSQYYLANLACRKPADFWSQQRG